MYPKSEVRRREGLLLARVRCEVFCVGAGNLETMAEPPHAVFERRCVGELGQWIFPRLISAIANAVSAVDYAGVQSQNGHRTEFGLEPSHAANNIEQA